MSASILRNLVSTVYKVKAKNVKLSGQMPTNWETSEVSTYGGMYSDEEWVNAWGFHPQKGFIKIEKILMMENAKSNANGTWENSYGYTAEYIAKECPDALFFIVNEGHRYKDSTGRSSSGDNWTLYKSPDFSEIWAEAEAKDVQRWEEWVNNL